MATIATIKKVSGYQAPDGTTHPTAKAAAEYVHVEAVKTALEEAFPDECLEGLSAEEQKTQGVAIEDRGTPVIYGTEVRKFIFANRDKVLAALTPKVEVRQRKPRAKKAATSQAPAGASA